MSELCKWCAYEHSDCKGNKDIQYNMHCQYYKKPVVFNAKEAAQQIQFLRGVLDQVEEDYYKAKAELEIMANRYKWTPITEREPDPDKHVLVTLKWKDDDYEVCELDYGVTKYCMDNSGDEDVVRWCKQMIEHVVAWMPLPDLYKDGDTDD